jgi:hypothetical protein
MKANLLPLLALLLLTQCHKSDPDPTKPEDQLPAATQTGAGTFGCLLNGQPWTPSGGGLFGNPNLLITYDPAYKGGNLAITAYRVLGSTINRQYIGVGGDGINQAGTYPLTTYTTNPTAPLRVPSFSDGSKTSPCDEYLSAPGTKARGQLILTRLDKVQGIVSGTFNFTLSQPGCDTIKVTQGRFDYKL